MKKVTLRFLKPVGSTGNLPRLQAGYHKYGDSFLCDELGFERGWEKGAVREAEQVAEGLYRFRSLNSIPYPFRGRGSTPDDFVVTLALPKDVVEVVS